MHYHINRRNYHMRNFQFISHNLIQMFPMWQSNILVKHQAMDNSQNTVNTINTQQNNPTGILRFDDKSSHQKKNNESNTYRTYITSKTLSFLTEIEEAEYQYRTKNRINNPLFHKRNYLFIDISHHQDKENNPH